METIQINNENNLPVEPTESKFKYFPFFNKKQPIFVLVLTGIIFYCTALYNEYALDDGIIIHQNNYVLKGVAGIKDILTKDAYDSFYKRMNATDQLQGGRYRPLSVVSFAVEQQIIGAYRTGYYNYAQDLNGNKILDNEKIGVPHSPAGSSISKQKSGSETNASQSLVPDYEYNEFVDLNGDHIAQENECNNCWDRNKNFRNDPSEDLNHDGVFNEVDCQVYGSFLRHFNNVWTYILGCVLLYLVFKRYIFKANQDMAFVAALIFLAHPVHTEIVANVKGRDEIFSLIFIALTFLFSFKFMENKKTSTLIIASVVFFLGLLSKEYAIMLLLIIPIAMYVFNKIKIDWLNFGLLTLSFLLISCVLIGIKLKFPGQIPAIILIISGVIIFVALVAFMFKKTFMNKELNALMIGLFTFSLLYIGLRLNAVSIVPGVPDTEILNNPYLLADSEGRITTKIFVLLKYIVLTVLPIHLTCDYSFADIPYKNFTDAGFIISLILNLALLILGIRLVIKRHVLGFAIIIYFAFLLLVTNFIFDVGATMREGFLFHSSIAFAIAFAWLLINGFEKWQTISFAIRRTIMIGSLSLILFLYGCKTWERNRDWKNDVTLFLKDVKTSPHSVLVLGNAGARWVDLADTKEITGITLPGEDSTVFNDYNGTLKITDEELLVGHYSNKREAALQKGIGYLKHAVELHPRYVNGYLNLGLASFKLNNDRDAVFYWKIAEFLYPNNPYLQNYYRVYSSILKNRGAEAFNENKIQEAALAYNLCTIVVPGDPHAWYGLGGAYYNLKKYNQAKQCWERTLKIDPGYEEARTALKDLAVHK